MKKYVIIYCLFAIPFVSFGQHPDIQHFYQKYASQEGATDINIQGWLLKLTAAFENNDEAEHAMSKISYLRVLLMDEGNKVEKRDVKQLTRDLQKDQFEELISVRDQKDRIRFFIKEKAKAITDVLLLVSGEDGFVLLSLEGLFDFKDLQHLNLDVEGGKYLKKFPQNRA